MNSRNMKKKDPTSHRIIEKRRRDRMNNCLADLSKLIPDSYMKRGRGRIEKTEIIEMAIRHMKDLIELSRQKTPASSPTDNADKQQQQQAKREPSQERAGNCHRDNGQAGLRGSEPPPPTCSSGPGPLASRPNGYLSPPLISSSNAGYPDCSPVVPSCAQADIQHHRHLLGAHTGLPSAPATTKQLGDYLEHGHHHHHHLNHRQHNHHQHAPEATQSSIRAAIRIMQIHNHGPRHPSPPATFARSLHLNHEPSHGASRAVAGLSPSSCSSRDLNQSRVDARNCRMSPSCSSSLSLASSGSDSSGSSCSCGGGAQELGRIRRHESSADDDDNNSAMGSNGHFSSKARCHATGGGHRGCGSNSQANEHEHEERQRQHNNFLRHHSDLGISTKQRLSPPHDSSGGASGTSNSSPLSSSSSNSNSPNSSSSSLSANSQAGAWYKKAWLVRSYSSSPPQR